MEESGIVEEEDETFELRLDEPPYNQKDKAGVTLVEE